MKLTWKIWLLIVTIMFAILAIAPWKYLDNGVLVKSVEKNSSLYESGLRVGMVITHLNGEKINKVDDYMSFMSKNMISGEEQKLDIQTKKDGGFISLTDGSGLVVAPTPNSNVKTGLDLSGGARAIVKAENASLSKQDVDDLVSITDERFNAFGLSDISVKPVSDLEGKNYMLIEIAGATTAELKDLLESQGKFEAKIGEDTVFIGGDRDITYVGISGQDAGIYSCSPSGDETYCQFRFTISLSEKAAQRQADITSNLTVNLSSGGSYLEKPLDLYVDDILLDTLQIGADLKGQTTTTIQISGSGRGSSQQDAYKDAQTNMKKLQTILKTGGLPYKLEIVKLDSISPALGKEFTKNLVYLALLVFGIISAILFIRYKDPKIAGAVVLTMFSEATITIAIATLLKQNLDAASIAGIIAGMGTGIDDQIVILSEFFNKEDRHIKVKQRIKNAFFVVIGAFFSTIAAMIPLFWAGAGMLRGFALTAIIGITVGILVTRPAFSDMIERMKKEEDGT